ncbi:DUF461 domain-containing protein [Streptomyces sp. MUM 203J]|uniref:DUF461 domain-containing protein n=1 Tax=Streptomyces sp. MUM 203J TaxID=2791990 RepID=UPI001F038114|nr:DUF461 domain-containing protein [Streptomyces sp. MUM 203J]MCH0538598.1 DUF461 domain-containing protein [Streptomyces sp. MUM 203J]
MSRSLRRGALAATALVFSLASLTACGAGNDAQTLGIRPDNAAVSVGTIQVQNALVITQPESGAEGPATVSATVFNNGDKAETLEAITLPGSEATVKLTPAEGSGPVTVPAGGSVIIGGTGNAAAEIENGHEATKNGDAQEVAFKLSETGEVKLQAMVVPSTGFYKDFGPSGAPSPAATPTTEASPSAETSPEATATGEAGAEHGDSH